jgi:hypothetical protein
MIGCNTCSLSPRDLPVMGGDFLPSIATERGCEKTSGLGRVPSLANDDEQGIGSIAADVNGVIGHGLSTLVPRKVVTALPNIE